MTGSSTTLNIGIFAVLVAATLVVVVRAGRRSRTATDFFAAGRSISGRQNGIAIVGDYISAAGFLGITGAIALNGYDGFLYAIAFVAAWIIALLLVAELLRNVGRFTLADVLSFRLRERPVRAAAAVSTLAVSFFYLLAQMAGAGGLVALLLDVTSGTGQAIIIAAVGVLMIIYVFVGGMRGTTMLQVIKAVLLLTCAVVLALWILTLFRFNPSALFGAAVERAGEGGQALLEPGKQYGRNGLTRLDFISLALALVLGTAALPHVLMRFYTVPTAREARRSLSWAIGLIGVFFLISLVLGYGAAAIVGPETISSAPGKANSAAPLLAFELGGPILLGVVAAVAFATILAVVAGLTITASASFAHDVWTGVLRRGSGDPQTEVRVGRITAVVVGILAIGGGILASGQNVAFLVALAFAVAASANLPTLLFSLFWKRFTTTGALWSIYGGLASSILLIIFSPVVSGKPVNPATGKSDSMIQGVDFHFFPLDNPGLVSIPLSFLLGIIASLLSRDPNAEARYREAEVRSLSGVGAEKATVSH